jgi:hypothetical protein
METDSKWQSEMETDILSIKTTSSISYNEFPDHKVHCANHGYGCLGPKCNCDEHPK